MVVSKKNSLAGTASHIYSWYFPLHADASFVDVSVAIDASLELRFVQRNP
jgi:hypothetical protein